MFHKANIFLFLTILLITGPCLAQESQADNLDFPDLYGDYLGQKPPGLVPEIFAKEIIATERTEMNSVFSPDGNEFYYAFPERGKYTIMVMRQVDGKWTRPAIAPFSGRYSDVDMCISYDGYRFFYSTKRPVPGTETENDNFAIWYMIRTENGWSEPIYIESALNSGIRSLYPTITYNGTLYFQSRRDGSIGGSDIWSSLFVNGKYAQPENLGGAINSVYDEYDILIAPDESYIIVSINGRPDSRGNGDFYISFRQSDGSWTEIKNMGETVNTDMLEFCPMLSPDGKYFFYTSDKTGDGDIYWVDVKLIETYKPDNLK